MEAELLRWRGDFEFDQGDLDEHSACEVDRRFQLVELHAQAVDLDAPHETLPATPLRTSAERGRRRSAWPQPKGDVAVRLLAWVLAVELCRLGKA